MDSLQLIEPTALLEKEYNEMLREWHQTGENLVPFILKYDPSDFKKFIDLMKGFKKGINIPETFVPHSTFWLVNTDNKILGVVNIRHSLTDNLRKEGGHIGYGIRPLERRKGYATKILALALIEADKLGITQALVTCDKDNIASQKTILKNKGKFNQESIVDGNIKLGYWIDI
jgi:predicted acetyltransferase